MVPKEMQSKNRNEYKGKKIKGMIKLLKWINRLKEKKQLKEKSLGIIYLFQKRLS